MIKSQARILALDDPLESSRISSWAHCGLNWTALAAFLVGAFQYVSFQSFGRIFVGELLLLFIFPVLAYDRFYCHRNEIARSQINAWRPIGLLALAILLTFSGYILSDLYRSNKPDDFLRGWARIFFLGIDIIGMAMLISIQRANIISLVLGYGVGGVIWLWLMGEPFSRYKDGGYAGAISALIVILAYFVRGNGWKIAILLAAGALNFLLDFRSMGAFFIAIAGIMWVNNRGGRVLEMVLVVIVSVVVLVGGYFATQGDFSSRRHASNSIRLSSAIVGFSAVLESPLIGYGSWGRDTRFGKLFSDITFRMSKTEDVALYDFDPIRLATIPAHSQFLESWIEGGILGISFFVCYLFMLGAGLRDIIFSAVDRNLTPVLGYFMISGLWDLFMSPFKGQTRFTIAFACIAAIIVRQMSLDLIDKQRGKEKRKISEPPVRLKNNL